MPDNKTAVLIFARSAEEELKHKPFLVKKSVVSVLHEQTLNVARKSNLPVIVYDETKQQGDHFGLRFANALQAVFDKGYDQIITIGNDCPQLKINHIIQAQESLSNHREVIGGTLDGGFYLLGISKNTFDKDTFTNFDWNKKNLYDEVFQFISRKSSRCTILPRLRDIDFFSDLEKIALFTISNSAIRNYITVLLRRANEIYFKQNIEKLLILHKAVLNKGSPQISSF